MPGSAFVFAEDSPDKSQFLQVPNPNLLYPPTQKEFKSVSLGTFSSESIGADENSSFKFTLELKGPNRIKKKTKPPLGPCVVVSSPVCFERKEKRSSTIIGGKGQMADLNKKKTKLDDLAVPDYSPKVPEEVKGEVKDKREFYMNSSGESTPHLYVDYIQRLNGILLKHFAEDEEI